MLKSKFTIWAYLLFIALPIMIYCLKDVYYNVWFSRIDLFPTIFASIFFPFLILLLFSELNTKVILIKISDDKITITKLFGLRPSVTYDISSLDGYKSAAEPSKMGPIRYTYLYKDNKRIAKISQLYHKNYLQLRKHLKPQLKNLGTIPSSYLRSFFDIFTW